MSEVKELYRYEAHDNESTVDLVLIKFAVVRETECGYWYVPWAIRNQESPMGSKWFKAQQRWVSKSSHKRRCYPGKDKAMESFIIRSKWRIRHLKRQIMIAEAAGMMSKEGDKIDKPEEFRWRYE